MRARPAAAGALVPLLVLAAACGRAAPPPAPAAPPPILDLAGAGAAAASSPPHPFRLPATALLSRGFCAEGDRTLAGAGEAHVSIPLRPLSGGAVRLALRTPPGGDVLGIAAATFNGHAAMLLPAGPEAVVLELPADWFHDGDNDLALDLRGPLALAAVDVTLPSLAARVTHGRRLRTALASGGSITIDPGAPLVEGAALHVSLLAAPELLPAGVDSLLHVVEVETLALPPGAAGELPPPEVLLKRRTRRGERRGGWVDVSIPLASLAGRRVRFHLHAAPRPGGADGPASLQGWGPIRLVTGPAVPPAPETANLLLLLVDTLRADALGAWGAPEMLTPTLDRFAARHVMLEEVIAQSTSTVPSLASFFGGRYYAPSAAAYEHAAGDGALFPQALARSGAYGLAIVANPLLTPAWAHADGFDEYEHRTYEDAATLHAALAARLPAIENGRFFAYLHYMDVHDPYGPGDHRPQAFTGEALAGLRWDGSIKGLASRIPGPRPPEVGEGDREIVRRAYLAGLGALDAELARLLATLRARGLDSRTTVAILSDHGEELWEHGLVGHGHSVYRELAHVPAILAPAGRTRDRSVGAPLEMLDVSATLLATMGIAPPGEHLGRVLALDGPVAIPPDDARFTESPPRPEARPPFAAHPCAVERGGWKLVRERRPPRTMLFDLVNDPMERRDLGDAHPEIVAQLGALLDAWERGTPAAEEGAAPSERMLEQEAEALRSLGYLD